MGIGDWFKGGLGKVSDFVQTPEGQMLMAGVGTGLDPQGVGGAIGKPTMNMLRTQSLKKERQGRMTADKQWKMQLLNLLGLGPPEGGGTLLGETPAGGSMGGLMTPPGQSGGDTALVKRDKDGRMKMTLGMDLGKMLMGETPLSKPRTPGVGIEEEELWQ